MMTSPSLRGSGYDTERCRGERVGSLSRPSKKQYTGILSRPRQRDLRPSRRTHSVRMSGRASSGL